MAKPYHALTRIDPAARNEYNLIMLNQLSSLPETKRQRLLLALFLALYISWVLWGSDQPTEQIWIGQFTLLFTGAIRSLPGLDKRKGNSQPGLCQQLALDSLCILSLAAL